MKSRFEVPFIGLCTLTFTQGNFFADATGSVGLSTRVNSSSVIQGFSGVENEARDVTVTGNIGYRIASRRSNWFVEPSVGWILVTRKSDPVTFLSAPTCSFRWRTVEIDDFESILGRATLRVGANVTQGIYTWQPFASVSVIHEFAGDVTSKITLSDRQLRPRVFFAERITVQRLDRTIWNLRPVWTGHGHRGGQHRLARLRAWRHQVRRERARRRLQRRPALSVVIGRSVAVESDGAASAA